MIVYAYANSLTKFDRWMRLKNYLIVVDNANLKRMYLIDKIYLGRRILSEK